MVRIAAAAAVILAAGSIWLLLNRAPRREIGKLEVQETPADQSGIPADRLEPTEDQPGIRTDQPGTPADQPASLSDQAESRTGRPEILAEQQTIREDLRESPDEVQPGFSRRQDTYQAEQKPLDESAMHMDSPLRINGKSPYLIRTGRAGAEPVLARRSQAEIPVRKDEGIDVFEEFGENGHAGYDKWAVGGQFSPVYSYRNLDAGTQAAYTTGFYNERENGIVSYAGGVNLNYFPAKRLSLQSGLYYSRMGMKVGNSYLASAVDQYRQPDIPGTPLALANSSGRVELGPDQKDVTISDSPPPEDFGGWDNATTSGEVNNKQEVRDGEVLQHFEYLEVPLLVRYRLVDRRMGLNLLGGLSTNFLVGSNVYFQEGGEREQIGTTGDLKPVNYSSVVGLGLQYSINRNFHINMEPTFRYYLNSINTLTGVGSHPYSLGFFTGISYSF